MAALFVLASVAERIPLAEAARAHELIEHGGYAGKDLAFCRHCSEVIVPSA